VKLQRYSNEVSVKDGLKLRCQNVKLFLSEPLVKAVFVGQLVERKKMEPHG